MVNCLHSLQHISSSFNQNCVRILKLPFQVCRFTWQFILGEAAENAPLLKKVNSSKSQCDIFSCDRRVILFTAISGGPRAGKLLLRGNVLHSSSLICSLLLISTMKLCLKSTSLFIWCLLPSLCWGIQDYDGRTSACASAPGTSTWRAEMEKKESQRSLLQGVKPALWDLPWCCVPEPSSAQVAWAGLVSPVP